jgi:hypothetical protein
MLARAIRDLLDANASSDMAGADPSIFPKTLR